MHAVVDGGAEHDRAAVGRRPLTRSSSSSSALASATLTVAARTGTSAHGCTACAASASMSTVAPCRPPRRAWRLLSACARPRAAQRGDAPLGRGAQRARSRAARGRARAAARSRPAPVSASMRRTLAALEVSLRITNDADLGGGAHVRAAAQLARVVAVADLHHAHDLAVLLAEQRHRAEAPRLLERRRDRADRVALGDPGVDRSSTSRSSSRAQRLPGG